MAPRIVSLVVALCRDHPRAIDRYIDYFGERAVPSARPGQRPPRRDPSTSR